ncbi:hypothetical protein [Vibrio rarus]|uniref:hypothetical protein n=1 Tax=Vibrio rarus TaxID=413403 RepID=UPI0021C3E1FD|nr:hypothetical protein [Vibrio rarus]
MVIFSKKLTVGVLLVSSTTLFGCGGGGDKDLTTIKDADLTLSLNTHEQINTVVSEVIMPSFIILDDYSTALNAHDSDKYSSHGEFIADSGSQTWDWDDQTSTISINYKNSTYDHAGLTINGNINDTSNDNYILTANINIKSTNHDKNLNISFKSINQHDWSMTTKSSSMGIYKVDASDLDSDLEHHQGHLTIVGKDNKKWLIDFFDGGYSVSTPNSESYNYYNDGRTAENRQSLTLEKGTISQFSNDSDSDIIASLVSNGLKSIIHTMIITENKSGYQACEDSGSYQEYDDNFSFSNCNKNNFVINGSLSKKNNKTKADLDINDLVKSITGHLSANSMKLTSTSAETFIISKNYYYDKLTFVTQYSNSDSNNQYVVLKSTPPHGISFDADGLGQEYPNDGFLVIYSGNSTWYANIKGSSFDLTSPNGTVTSHYLDILN